MRMAGSPATWESERRRPVHVSGMSAGEDLEVRVYNGHRGKFSHEFNEYRFQRHGGRCHLSFSHARGKEQKIQRKIELSSDVMDCIENLILENDVMDLQSADWPQTPLQPGLKGKAYAAACCKDVLEIRRGTRCHTLEMVAVLSIRGLPPDQGTFFQVMKELREIGMSARRRGADPFSGAPKRLREEEDYAQPTAKLLATASTMAPSSSTRTDGADSSASAVASHAMSIAATSSFSVYSTQHSRERMEERDITKRDLQRAVKFAGHLARPGNPSNSGHPTLLVEFEGIVYCTDLSKKVAISAWRARDGHTLRLADSEAG